MGEFFLRPAKREAGFAMPGWMKVGARLTTTTSGALAASPDLWGIDSVVKTAAKTGRYTFTLPRTTQKFYKGVVTFIGPDDAALTTTKGLIAVWRDNDLESGGDGTIELQFVQTNAGNADTELQDGMKFNVDIELIDSDAR